MIIFEHAERARAFRKGNPSQKFIDIAIDDVFTAEAVMHAKDALITELTTEVADLKSKLDFANAMNADQDNEVVRLRDDVTRLRGTLLKIREVANDDTTSLEVISDTCYAIARNALKEVM